MVSKVLFLFAITLLLCTFASSYSGNNKDDGKRSHLNGLRDDVQKFQNELEETKPSSTELTKVIKELTATFALILDEMDSASLYRTDIEERFENMTSALNETRCSLSTRLIDIENRISEVGSGAENQLKDPKVSRVRKMPKLLPENFILTPSMTYLKARRFCYDQGFRPFVPKEKEELNYLTKRVTESNDFGWLPLTDIFEEGVALWDDGSAYVNGKAEVQFTDLDATYGNTEAYDCVDISKNGLGDWYKCSSFRKMLCLKGDH